MSARGRCNRAVERKRRPVRWGSWALVAIALALGASTLDISPVAGQAPPPPRIRVHQARLGGDGGRILLSVPASPGDVPPSPNAFTLSQKNRAVPADVRRLSGEGSEVVLVLDTVPAVADLPGLEARLQSFLDGLPDGTKVALVAAGSKATVLTPMTVDREQVLDGFRALQPTKERAGVSALALAVDQFSTNPATRRTIVSIGVGYTTEADTAEAVSRRATDLSVMSYPILVDRALVGTVRPVYPLPLQGGQLLQQSDIPVDRALDQVAAQLNDQYLITFSPPRRAGATYQLRLREGTTDITQNVFLFQPRRVTATTNSSWLLPVVAAAIAVMLLAFATLVLYVLPRRRARRSARVGEASVSVNQPSGSRPAAQPATKASRRGRDAVGLGGEQVEGIAAVEELLRARARRVHSVDLAPGTRAPQVVALAEASRVPVVELSMEDWRDAVQSEMADGVLAYADPLRPAELELLSGVGDQPLTVVVVAATLDPVPLGQLLAAVFEAGATAVVLPRGRSNPVTSTVTASAAGAIEHLQICLMANPATALALMRDREFLVLGVSPGDVSTLLERSVYPDLSSAPVAVAIGTNQLLDRRVEAWCNTVVGVRRSGADAADAPTLARLACADLALRRRLPVDA